MGALNILDIIIIIIVLIGGIIGFSKGFFSSMFSFAGKILAAYLALTFIKPFMYLIQIKELFMPGLVNIINERLPMTEELKNLPVNSGSGEADVLFNGQNMIMEIIGQNLINDMDRLYMIGQRLDLSTIGELLSLVIANYLLNIISFFLLFFLILIVIAVFKAIVLKLLSLSDIATGIDKFLGMFFGAAVDLFILSLILGFAVDLLFLIPASEDGFIMTAKEHINQSYLQEYLYSVYRLFVSEGFKLL